MIYRQLLSLGLLLSFLGAAPNVAAQCNYDDADRYNGWGWNPTTNQSCPPVPEQEQEPERDQGQGQCEDHGHHPWGWNPVTRQSCRLDTAVASPPPEAVTSLTPETDRYRAHSAPVLPFNQSQASTLPAGTFAHYYRIELSEAMALQIDGTIDSDLDVAAGTVYKGQHSYSLNHGEPARCFSSGTHIVIVSRSPSDTDKQYNINVTAQDQQCVEPTQQVVNNEHPDGDWYVDWATASDGTTFSIPIFWDGMTAYDQNGELLWSTGQIYPTSTPDRLSDGSTAVLSINNSLRLLDTRGEFLWTVTLDQTEFPRAFTKLVANDDTIVVYNLHEVASFNGYDGSLRWRYSPRDYVSSVSVADNGKVLVHGSEDPYVGVYYLEK